jgi:hypothetical protein
MAEDGAATDRRCHHTDAVAIIPTQLRRANDRPPTVTSEAAIIAPFADAVLHYGGAVLLATATQMLVLLGPGMAIGLLMHLVAGAVERRALLVFGRRLFLGVFGWAGTVVHEAGHALFCVLFGHRITGIKWFDPAAHDGALGSVSHRWNPASRYQRIGNFFIGIGPILLGTLVVYLAATWLLGPSVFAQVEGVRLPRDAGMDWTTVQAIGSRLWAAVRGVVGRTFTTGNIADWRFYLFLWMTFAVGSAVRLSPSDLRGAGAGLAALALVWLAFNAATLWIGDFAAAGLLAIARVQTVFHAAMAFAMLMYALVAAVVVLIPAAIGVVRAMTRAARGR